MNLDKIANIAGAIVTVALVATILTNAGGAAQVINSLGDAFSHSIASAQGRAS